MIELLLWSVIGLVIVAFLCDYGWQQYLWWKHGPWTYIYKRGNDITYSNQKGKFLTVQYRSIDGYDP